MISPLRNLPESLEIIATDSEGNCEAICHKSLPIEGWMWHPERENHFPQSTFKTLEEF